MQKGRDERRKVKRHAECRAKKREKKYMVRQDQGRQRQEDAQRGEQWETHHVCLNDSHLSERYAIQRQLLMTRQMTHLSVWVVSNKGVTPTWRRRWEKVRSS